MAVKPRRHQILNSITVTASGNSGPLPNLARDLYPTMLTVYEVPGAVTGTNPTLDIYVYAVLPSGSLLQLLHLPQLIATTGTTPLEVTTTNVLYDTLQVNWVIGGTASPTFTGVNVDLYFASPDA